MKNLIKTIAITAAFCFIAVPLTFAKPPCCIKICPVAKTTTATLAIEGGSGVSMVGFSGRTLSFDGSLDGTGSSTDRMSYNGVGISTGANGTVKVTETKSKKHCCKSPSVTAWGNGSFKAKASGCGLVASGNKSTYNGNGNVQGAGAFVRYSTSSVVHVGGHN